MLFKVKIQDANPTITYTCWRQPTKGELKFGEGAIHYRYFTEFEIGRSTKGKNTGKLKKRFKADDGLFYNLDSAYQH